jgi:Protein of unknown function (DUF4013)
MDIARAFTYVFDDEQWLSIVLVGGLLLLIPFAGPILLTGYMLEAARNVANGSPRPLPRWENFGEKFSSGIAAVVIQLVYALPVILLSCVLVCVAVGSVATSGGNEERALPLIIGAVACLMPLILLISLVSQPLTLAALVRYLQTGDLGTALRVGEVLQLTRANLSTWVVLWLLQALCGIVAGLGSVALVIGVFFTARRPGDQETRSKDWRAHY